MTITIKTITNCWTVAARHRHFFGYLLGAGLPLALIRLTAAQVPLSYAESDLLGMLCGAILVSDVMLFTGLLMFFGYPMTDRRPEVVERTVLTTKLSFTNKEGAEQFLAAINKEI